VGVASGEIRAACARDLRVLNGGGQSARDVVITGSGPVAPGLKDGVSAEQIVEAAITHAAALGLELRAHVGLLERQEVRLDPSVASALNEALAECVNNVRLHAGVDHLDLVASATGGALVVLIIDEGHGFDPAAVPEDRLGLRASVLERLSALGGSAAVWSRPDHGTSVKLRLPLLAATS
jgi:signal transduction histidine kinase